MRIVRFFRKAALSFIILCLVSAASLTAAWQDESLGEEGVYSMTFLRQGNESDRRLFDLYRTLVSGFWDDEMTKEYLEALGGFSGDDASFIGRPRPRAAAEVPDGQ